MIAETAEKAQAYLPDDLLEEILEGTTSVSSSIRAIFEQISRQRQRMRNHLVSTGCIAQAGELGDPIEDPTVSAVDGGLAIERSIGADTVLVVALGVEGLVTQGRRRWNGVQHSHWQRVVAHEGGESSRRFALGVMAALELEILAAAPHDIVILDGSHLTPVIGLNSMLSLDNAELGCLASQLLVERHVETNLTVAMQRPSIVAMVKYDASRDLSQALLSAFECTCDDRTAMTILLEPGEFTKPMRAGQVAQSRENWEKLHVTIGYSQFPNKGEVERRLDEALEYVRGRNIYFTYYKPHEWAPAYRIEVKREAAQNPALLCSLLSAVRDQVLSPEIREPYPQYLADVMAKSVGDGMAALQTAVFHELSDTGAGEHMRLITQSYRTEA